MFGGRWSVAVVVAAAAVCCWAAAPECVQVRVAACRCLEHGRLDCTHGNLTEVPAVAAAVWLNLSDNLVSSLGDDAFSWPGDAAASVSHLSLHRNRISEVADGAFHPLVSLTHLNLGSNRISRLPERALVACPNLASLTLNHNPLTELPALGFPLPRLRRLGLQGCRLRHLPERFFERMRGLTHLDLAFNRLSRLEAATLGPLKRLRSLALHHNRLSSVAALLALPPDADLHLAGNPWRCDCALAAQLRTLLRSRPQLTLQCGFTAHGPFLTSLREVEGLCRPRGPLLVAAGLAGAALLLAGAGAAFVLYRRRRARGGTVPQVDLPLSEEL